MKRYVVFEPPGAAAPSGEARFVRDEFSFLALVLPVVWLLWHGLLISALLALAAILALDRFAAATGSLLAEILLPILPGVLVALEGPSLRAWRLRRKSWRETAVVFGNDRAEAEYAYFAAAPAGVDLPPTANAAVQGPAPRRGGRSLLGTILAR